VLNEALFVGEPQATGVKGTDVPVLRDGDAGEKTTANWGSVLRCRCGRRCLQHLQNTSVQPRGRSGLNMFAFLKMEKNISFSTLFSMLF